MLKISEKEIVRRFRVDNPWWQDSGNVGWKNAPQRICFTQFYKLATIKGVNRAIVLTGTRGVGKTVMIHQAITRLIDEKVRPERILYVRLGNPLYSVCSLEEILLLFVELNKVEHGESVFVFFDEIQYMRDWQIHLKCLVDSYPQHRFVAAASGDSALKLKSRESGAGRFTDFFLPHPTFYEYVKLSGKEKLLARNEDGRMDLLEIPERIEAVNEKFVDYINFGGYPETAFLKEPEKTRRRGGGNDFVGDVLLRDLPSLYGISDIPKLNRLLTTLVLNTGSEIDPQGLFRGSKAAMGTISRYLEYLEAAFLIRRVSRVDKRAKIFRRKRKFKTYPSNPSIHTALFGPVGKEAGEIVEKLTETAVFGHFFELAGNNEKPYYARWRNGKVDMVLMDRIGTKPESAIEIRWSDGPVENPSEIKGLLDFAAEHKLSDPGSLVCCTRGKTDIQKHEGKTVLFYPASLVCFELGRCASIEEFREALVSATTKGSPQSSASSGISARHITRGPATGRHDRQSAG